MEKTELTSLDGVRLEAAVHHPQAGPGRGTVIYAHGITADLDEFGTATRVADELSRLGHAALRFSFRGHGGSGGTQRGVTLAGEMLDLQAAVEYAQSRLPGPLSIVASSFGAVSTSLSLPWLNDRLHRLVLMRPVLDLHRTFIAPETPWGQQHYSEPQQHLLNRQGFILVNGTFELGRTLFEELRRHDPMAPFLASTIPALIVQGDQDSVVSYEIAHRTAASRPFCHLHTVSGADHGFDSHEYEAVRAAVGWLTGDPTGHADGDRGK
jgi:alpha-beta hydrolase superfamily lysophospholipase